MVEKCKAMVKLGNFVQEQNRIDAYNNVFYLTILDTREQCFETKL